MRLVDTSAWIEWLIDSTVGQALAEHIPEQGAWLVPTIVQMEMAKWIARERGDASAAREVIGFSRQCAVADLDTDIAIHAAYRPRIKPEITQTAAAAPTPMHSAW